MHRIWGFARWLVGTRWPLYAASMGLANIVGAIAVYICLRVLIPESPATIVGDLTPGSAWTFTAYLIAAVIIGGIGGVLLTLPVLRWQRDTDSDAALRVRRRAVRIPLYHAILHLVLWAIGVAMFTVMSVPRLGSGALTIAVAGALGAITTSALGYLQAERILRPVATAALSRGAPTESAVPGVLGRIMITWMISTGVPIGGIALMVGGFKLGILPSYTTRVLDVTLIVAVLTLAIGLASFLLVGTAIGDPIRQLRNAQVRVQSGDLHTPVPIYDASEIGVLQAGFNDMIADLEERQRLRDLFGRYVGEDVARRALQYGPELGGVEQYVAVLFVDLVGSTRLAATAGAEVVVLLLNEFFREVVEAVDLHGGFVNKFQGDAALAVFGAPLNQDDPAGAALAAARELRARLDRVVGRGEFGIGVSAGSAIAGHIGAAARFEFTVIGDPVNEAARLTELAKTDRCGLLASTTAVEDAAATEQQRWISGETVHLRGRTDGTRLARPRS